MCAIRFAGGLVLVGTLSLPHAAAAQPPGEPSGASMICESVNGQRTFCAADTRQGVRLVRRISDARCEEGYSWGFTESGIWVDRGCRAEFAVPAVTQGRGPVNPYDERRGPSNPYGERWMEQIPAGTLVPVRTEETIHADRTDGRVFRGVVDDDVSDRDGRLAIPRGSLAQLMVRTAPDGDLVVDLESLFVNGQRYEVRADENRTESPEGIGANRHTGEYVGGGALLGTIIGAIAGGGKGAAIGAATGAAAGAGGEILTHGKAVRIPAESLLTFRLERPLEIRR